MTEQLDREAEEIIEPLSTRAVAIENARKALVECAFEMRSPAIEAQDIWDETDGDRFPTFELGLRPFDVQGGACGLTTVGGRPGAGKSTLALGASLLSASQEVQTFVLDAENHKALVRQRVGCWYGLERMSVFMDLRERGVWQWIPIESGQPLIEIARYISQRLDRPDVLIVADSVTQIARMIAACPETDGKGRIVRRPSYLDVISQLGSWMRSVTRKTNGRVRFIALSELNASGGMKGVDIEHQSDVVISIDYEDQQAEDHVRISVRKNRNGRVDRKGRIYELRWRKSCFEPAERDL